MAEIPSGVTRSGTVNSVQLASMAPALIQHTLHDTHAITIDPSIMHKVCNGFGFRARAGDTMASGGD